MSAAFDACFALVVGNEGGYVDDPADPGRATKYGISQAAFPHLDIAALTLDQAKAIYLSDYWQRIRGDEMPAPVALAVFDSAINSGVGAAAKWLQEAAGVTADGFIGPQTLAAVAHADPAVLISDMLARRIVADAALSTWSSFALGWARRVCRLPFQAQTVGA